MRALAIYIGKRLLWTLPTLLLVGLIVFVMVRLIPGDPVQVALGDQVSAGEAEAFRARLGLDQPVPLQFLYWLGRAVQGDLGNSISNGQPVLTLMLGRFQVTFLIMVLAVALATSIAVPAGMVAAWKQNGRLDFSVVAVSTLLMSVPSFWLGLLMLIVFGVKLGWLPVVGFVPLSENPRAALTYMILPIATLTLIEMGVLTRMVRASTIEILRLEYITHARAKGLSERQVLLRHALPNAFGPIWTMIGLILGGLLGGAAVLETVFTLPGLGRFLVDAIFARDYPVVQGCLLFTALVYVIVNLIVDLCYPLFDPRVVAS
jgi:peptide/nickel transport system permease protein